MPNVRWRGPHSPSWMVRAWRVARAHLFLGEIPIERLDLAELPSAARAPSADESHPPHRAIGEPSGAKERVPHAAERRLFDPVDESVDESFPASDPPSWTSSHA